jgi:hypothetical protein
MKGRETLNGMAEQSERRDPLFATSSLPGGDN